MAPAFVADSDDESDGSPLSSPRVIQAEEILSFGNASDLASPATSSTDPVFFQNVYKEQITAAQEHQCQNTHLNAPTGTGQTDPISLPSHYSEQSSGAVTPLGLRNASPGHRSAIKSAKKRKKRGKVDDADGRDPWSIPSSADELQQRSVLRTGVGDISNSSMTNRHTRETNEGGEDELPKISGRKRQRLKEPDDAIADSSLPATALPDIDDSPPPTMPVGDGDAPTSIVAPETSTDGDPSIFIHQHGLTRSQKEEYVAMDMPPSSNQERQPLSEEILSCLPPHSSARTPDAKKKKGRMAARDKKGSAAKRRGVKASPCKQSMSSLQLETEEKTPEKKQCIVLPDSEDDGAADDDVGVVEPDEQQDSVCELPSSPVKVAKKTRGRPRKTENQAVEVAVTRSEDIACTEVVDDSKKGRKQPKKRGRPRKSDIAVVEDGQECSTNKMGDAASDAVEDVAKEAVANLQAKGTDGNGNTQSNKPAKTEAEETLENSAQRTAETPQKAASKDKQTPKQSCTGKPLYRIGLSKRSRIAPLLKSLPK